MSENTNTPFTIKQWAEDDRPREKLLLKGRSALTDAELIAILIATGTKDDSAVDVAKKILALTKNSLANLGTLSVPDLQKVKGIGEAKAITIIAALELGRRRKTEEPIISESINKSEHLYLLFEPVLSDLPHEEFWVLLLNRANKVIGLKKVSVGGVAGTLVDFKIILKFAIENLASVIVVGHNHPSGNIKPSDADIKLTSQLKSAAKLIDVFLLDHIIIGNKAYFSFADENLL